MRPQDTTQERLCACGCGGIVTSNNPKVGFIHGHNRRRINQYRVDESTGCWVWLGSRNWRGYGMTCINKRTTSAHRAMYQRVRGDIPPGMDIDHLCRNRACVNPDHMEVVTRAENVRRGNLTKLTEDDVRAIRSLASTTPHRDIATRFGISKSNVEAIIYRKRWKNV